jgi:hypothetical protein
MVPREALDARGMLEAYREWLNAGAQERRPEVLRCLELAQGALDGDLPDHDSAKQDLVGIVG